MGTKIETRGERTAHLSHPEPNLTGSLGNEINEAQEAILASINQCTHLGNEISEAQEAILASINQCTQQFQYVESHEICTKQKDSHPKN